MPTNIKSKSSSWCFDIVNHPEHTRCKNKVFDRVATACFTKSYSRYIKGTGSVLLLNDDGVSSSSVCNGIDNGVSSTNTDSSSDMSLTTEVSEESTITEHNVSVMRLRYFSPRELLNLFGFPAEFNFNSTELLNNTHTGRGCNPDTVPDISNNNENSSKRRKREHPEFNVTRKQSYELIGNSINVSVVSCLLLHMFNQFPVPASMHEDH